MTLPLASSWAAGGGQVQIDTGAIEGTMEDGIRIFRGIPYAAPPVGDLRWQPPQPMPPWDGVRKADQFGARSMQAPLFPDMIFRDAGGSEDCLYLNVWTPAAAAVAGWPVMVWIHGGGFIGGSSSEPRQDGRNLARKGVVVVSMNYRLGVFGFFSHPDLSREQASGASGNYGLLDQAAALAWVRRNIGAFGGDPGRITIFGESAGSFAVSALLASPLTRGLMHGAIGESGAFFGHTLAAVPLEQSEQSGVRFARNLGAASIAALRAKSAAELLQVATNDEAPYFGPNVDGWFLPRPVRGIFENGEQAHVPLLAGWNAHEAGTPEEDQSTVQTFTAENRPIYGDQWAEFLRLYPAGSDAEARLSASALKGDQWMGYATWKWIELQKQTGGRPVYRYRFDHALPQPAGTASRGAYHSSEIEYVFDNLHLKDLPFADEDHRLSDQISSYWTNFARTGDPNADGLPVWPAYEQKTGFQVMHLDVPPQAAPDEHRQRYQFLDAYQSRPARAE